MSKEVVIRGNEGVTYSGEGASELDKSQHKVEPPEAPESCGDLELMTKEDSDEIDAGFILTGDDQLTTKVDSQVFSEFQFIQRRLASAQEDEADKKEIHGNAKARTKALEEDLHAICHELSYGRTQPTLPFKNTSDTKPLDDTEAWRNTPIGDLALGGILKTKLENKFSKNPTLGAVADFSNRGGQFQDIDGIGIAKADEIADAMTVWFANHPESFPSVKENINEETGEITNINDADHPMTHDEMVEELGE